ncbi:hypothetical protein GCM10009651_18350 [Microbacterium natoriense]
MRISGRRPVLGAGSWPGLKFLPDRATSGGSFALAAEVRRIDRDTDAVGWCVRIWGRRPDLGAPGDWSSGLERLAAESGCGVEGAVLQRCVARVAEVRRIDRVTDAVGWCARIWGRRPDLGAGAA